MKNKFLIVFILPTLLFNTLVEGQSKLYKQYLSPVEFQEKMQKLPNASIVDVRTPEEFNGGHLQNAININIASSNFERQISQLDKNKPVLVYCLSGSRSNFALSSFRNGGFKEVYDLSGGLIKWRAAGLPEASSGKSKSLSGMSMAQFKEYLNTDKIVLVDIYADWCAPCKKMAPSLDEIQKEMVSNVSIIRINADQNKSLVSELGVTALPTLMIYKNKAKKWSNIGFMTKDEIKSHLKNN